MKYKATVRFSGFLPGEIIEIPEDNDLPESFFTQGYLVPLEKPKKQVAVKAPAPTPIKETVKTDITFGTNSTNTVKPDKLD
jgi:hypothetical protein